MAQDSDLPGDPDPTPTAPRQGALDLPGDPGPTPTAPRPGAPDPTVVDDATRLGRPRTAPASPIASPAPGGTLATMEADAKLRERFQPGEAIGEGGMGEVRAYLDGRIGREVAIKTMQPQWTQQSDLRTSFLREAALQGRLEHPSIVPVHDVGIDEGGRPYFIMKRVRGTTLHEILVSLARHEPGAEKRFSRRRLLEAFVRVCLALDFAHEQGVIHRDIKPSNLMLGDFGEVYILDWGLAHVRGEATGMQNDRAVQESINVLGTPGYMAPEQITSPSADLDERADVYALGVILYEILTQRRFLRGLKGEEKIAATLAGKTPDPASVPLELDIPPELHAIWQRAVALDPEDRYPTARALADDVEAYFEGVRDEEVRHALAERHAQEAEAVITNAGADWQEEMEHRRQAMRLVGRSLALEPNNPKVLRILYSILAKEPSEPSEEVKRELDRAAQEKAKFALGVGGKVMLAWYLAVPFMFWSGVRNWDAFTGLFVMTAVASGTILWCARRPRVTGAMLSLCVGLVCATVAYGSRWYGPLVLTPGILIPIIGAFCMTELRVHRLAFVVLGTLTIVVPPLLEVAGLVPQSYRFDEGTMAIVPQLVEFPAAPTVATLIAIYVASLVSNGLFASLMRDYLTAAETRAFGLLWSLRQLIPSEGSEGYLDPKARPPS